MNSRSNDFTLRPIGHIESELTELRHAPKQGEEGAPAALLVFEEWVRDGLRDLRAGETILLITWLDRGDRSVLRVHPRSDRTVPQQGVFSTRSPSRPNPIGLHRVKILEVRGDLSLKVSPLEAIHGTPILDLKPVLSADEG